MCPLTQRLHDRAHADLLRHAGQRRNAHPRVRAHAAGRVRRGRVPYDRLYDARTFPPPVGGLEDLHDLSPHYREEVNRHFWDSLGPEQVQRARAFYAGTVTLIDHCVGQLRQTLAVLGIARDTVVCFTADHGDLLSDHGLFFKARFFRDLQGGPDTVCGSVGRPLRPPRQGPGLRLY